MREKQNKIKEVGKGCHLSGVVSMVLIEKIAFEIKKREVADIIGVPG